MNAFKVTAVEQLTYWNTATSLQATQLIREAKG